MLSLNYNYDSVVLVVNDVVSVMAAYQAGMFCSLSTCSNAVLLRGG